MMKILYVGLGGFLGAAARYIISINSLKWFGNQFPYGTLIVNVAGGFLIGLLIELSLTTDLITPDMRLFLTTGILGGLTTFSTFSYETISLFTNGNYMFGSLNVLFNVFLSLGGVVLGKMVVMLLNISQAI